MTILVISFFTYEQEIKLNYLACALHCIYDSNVAVFLIVAITVDINHAISKYCMCYA